MKTNYRSLVALAALGLSLLIPAAPAHAGPGNALSFDGPNNSVSANIPTLASNYTISAWVNLRRGGNYGTSRVGLLTGSSSGNSVEFLIRSETANAADPQYLELGRSGAFSGQPSISPVPLNQWVQVAITVSSNKLVNYFINGNAAGSWDASGLNVAVGPAILLGSQNAGRHFDGLLDEVQIWNVARSQAEIQAGMNQAPNVAAPNLTAFGLFDEGTGTATTADASGHGHTGTLLNGPLWMSGVLRAPDSSASYGAGSLFAAGASGNIPWTTTSSAWQVVRQCKLAVPWNGQVFITANTSLGRSDGDYEARLSINMDSPNGDVSIDRWVNVYSDTGDGTDENAALSILKPVSAGVHTFYLLASRYGGTGTVQLHDPSLTVVYTPSVNTQVVVAGASGNGNWTTTNNSFQVVRQCTLTAPGAGQVFIAADTSLTRLDGDYEAQLRLGVDTVAGDNSSDRWVNISSDTGDGTDRNGALSILKPVSAGVHTFYLLAKRYNGTGTVNLLDSSLTVIFTPSANTQVVAAGASDSVGWTTTSSSLKVVSQCTFTAPRDGQVFIAADASLGRSDGDYEASLRLGMDSTSGDVNTDRWVNIYSDAGDGTDKNGALSILKPISAGVHTFYLLAARYGGTGTVNLYKSTLTAIFVDGPEVPPVISAPHAQAGVFTMTINNLTAGTTNDILTTPRLFPSQWTTSATFQAVSLTTNWSTPTTTTPSRFYRVRTQY